MTTLSPGASLSLAARGALLAELLVVVGAVAGAAGGDDGEHAEAGRDADGRGSGGSEGRS